MLIHLEDDTTFNMIVDDAGTLLVVCPRCKKVWTGKLTLAETPDSAQNIDVRHMLQAALQVNPSFLDRVGLDRESISALISY